MAGSSDHRRGIRWLLASRMDLEVEMRRGPSCIAGPTEICQELALPYRDPVSTHDIGVVVRVVVRVAVRSPDPERDTSDVVVDVLDQERRAVGDRDEWCSFRGEHVDSLVGPAAGPRGAERVGE